MSFSSLLAGYAKSKTEPLVEKKSGPAPPKSHHLKPVLENIRYHVFLTNSAHQRASSQHVTHRCFTTRSSRSSFTPSSKEIGSAELNLGILVLIIDDCPNELLWRLWLEQVSDDGTYQESTRVRMWFHAKCPEKVRSPWVRERLVRGPSFKPEWGSLEITKAMAHMLHEALVDAPHINKFCFASESCMPIRSLDTTLQCLYANQSTPSGDTQHTYDFDSSWLCYSDVPNNGYAQQLQFDPLARALPAGCVFKASQWALLSRVHAQAVIDLMQQVGDASTNRATSSASGAVSGTGPLPALPPLSTTLFGAFALVSKASDEMFFPSCLAVTGAIDAQTADDSATNASNGNAETQPATATEITSTGSNRPAPVVLKRQVTYCDWTNNAKSPQEYTSLPTALVAALTANTSTANVASSTTSTSAVKTAVGSTNKQALEALHIHPEQVHACFLRKIKFPIRYLAAVGSGSSGESSTTVVLNEVQEVFLHDWLPFVTSSHLGVTGSGESCDGVEKRMQSARTLFSTVASYPAPVRAINKRALPTEEEHRSAGNSGKRSNDRIDRSDRSGGSSYGTYSDNSTYDGSGRSSGRGSGRGSDNRYAGDGSRDRGYPYNYNIGHSGYRNNADGYSQYDTKDGSGGSGYYSNAGGYRKQGHSGHNTDAYSNKTPRK